jgi:hypothetical protein
MKRALLLVLVVLMVGCGSQKPGKLGFFGDRVIGTGMEFWRAPDGRRIYFHEKVPRIPTSWSGPVGDTSSQCSPAYEVIGRTVWHWPVWIRASGAPRVTAPELHRFASRVKVWERFGATSDEAKIQLADTRSSPKPIWVKEFESCLAHKGKSVK